MLILGITVALVWPASGSARIPPRFFGVVPQETLSDADGRWMSAGGIETVRLPLAWSKIESTPGHYDWTGVDRAVEVAASHDLDVLPFLYGTPGWLGTTLQTLPTQSEEQRSAWADFVEAAVRRYGPGGDFWLEHSPFSADPVPLSPIRRWQVWNEENFFYFAYPVSPAAYSRLLTDSAEAIRSVDPGARVLLGGLYGRPRGAFPKAMRAASYLRRLYEIPGTRKAFDDVAIHPYAAHAGRMTRLVEAVRRVIATNHDDAGLLITEFGWGSQNDPEVVSFERGAGGQALELRRAYRSLIAARLRLRLRGVYWFSWKDGDPHWCRICNSTGLFRRGAGFHPKPAWRAFTSFTGGHRYPY